MRTINIKGEGKVTQSPDTIEIDLVLITLNKDYEKMMEEASKKVYILSKQLIELGFKENDIKTTNFMINAKYENVLEYQGKYTNKFIGYEARHSLKISFPIDTMLLGDILSSISKDIVKPEVSIRFTIKDRQPLVNKLLESAVLDAKNKAEVLAKASGVNIGKIQEINYNWKEIRPYSDTMVAEEALYSIDRINIVPEDIELTDTVSISYEII